MKSGPIGNQLMSHPFSVEGRWHVDPRDVVEMKNDKADGPVWSSDRSEVDSRRLGDGSPVGDDAAETMGHEPFLRFNN